MRKIYLAAAYERAAEMRVYRDELHLLGYTVTSRWIDQTEQDSALGASSLTLAPELGAPFAVKDVSDINAADTMIHFTGGGRGGRQVEYGMAYILRKFLIVVGAREHVFHCLPGVDWYPDWDALASNLARFPERI
jgi:hypothetical protein